MYPKVKSGIKDAIKNIRNCPELKTIVKVEAMEFIMNEEGIYEATCVDSYTTIKTKDNKLKKEIYVLEASFDLVEAVINLDKSPETKIELLKKLFK